MWWFCNCYSDITQINKLIALISSLMIPSDFSALRALWKKKYVYMWSNKSNCKVIKLERLRVNTSIDPIKLDPEFKSTIKLVVALVSLFIGSEHWVLHMQDFVHLVCNTCNVMQSNVNHIAMFRVHIKRTLRIWNEIGLSEISTCKHTYNMWHDVQMNDRKLIMPRPKFAIDHIKS